MTCDKVNFINLFLIAFHLQWEKCLENECDAFLFIFVLVLRTIEIAFRTLRLIEQKAKTDSSVGTKINIMRTKTCSDDWIRHESNVKKIESQLVSLFMFFFSLIEMKAAKFKTNYSFFCVFVFICVRCLVTNNR